MTKKRNNRWAILAIFSFFISLFCASAWFISNAWFRDQDSMENDVDTAAVQIENNTKYSMSTVVNLALADQYLLDRDITFNITEKSSEVYVRCALKFTCTSGAEVAKDMIKFQDYKLGSNIGYSWQQFGEFYYLCDETGIPKTIERSQAGQIFTFVQKDNMLLPRDAIVEKHFTSADQVTMTIEIEAIQGRNLEDSSMFELNQYFLTEIPSNTYTVKFHEADGTILSEQANIAYGSNAIVPEIEKVKSSDHTTFAYWSTTEDGDGLKIREADEARIFSNISQNMEVWPVYAHDQVKIDVTYGNGGQITPGSTTIDWGTGKTFRVVADSGHAIQQIKRDGVVIYDFSGSKIDMFDYVLENVVADTQIEAIFEPVTYEIIVITVGNGTVNPGTTTAIYGSSKVFTITPDNGHRIWSITLDGVDMPVTASSGNAQRFTISDINSDHILSVKFVTSVLKITTVAGSNGSIRPTELEVEYDSFASVSIVPNEGYEIASIHIDGVKVDDSKVSKGGVAQNVAFEHVTEDHEVRATFSKIQLTITASVSGDGGTISPNGTLPYEYGATASFVIAPDPQKTIDKIYVDGAEVAVSVTEGDKQTYLFENIKESHTIVVSFKQSFIRLDINGGSGSQPSVSYSLDGTKFTLSNVEPKGPGGKEFYYYSTRPLDNERGQLGDRYDLGFEYDIPDLDKTTTLYAIYLEPTQDLSVYSQYMVFPKGTKNIQRIGFNEAMQEANKQGGLSALLSVLLAVIFSTSQQDYTLVYCTLPAGVNSLDYYAFSGCKALTGVSVPASLSVINQMAFSNTTSLTSFTIPYSCTSIGSNVFESSSVQEIKMNKKLQSIGSAAFKSSGLKRFKAQSSITSMGKVTDIWRDSEDKFLSDVFENCLDLVEIDFSEQTSFLGQIFQGCVSLSTAILPNRLTEIPEGQFRNCSSLAGVSYKNGDQIVNKFPSTLKTIGRYAFYYCAFTDLLLDDCSKVLIGEYSFAGNNFSNLIVPTPQIAEVMSYAFSSSDNLLTIEWKIENQVPEYCFAYSKKLKSFTATSIKNGIEDCAFIDCSSLNSVTLTLAGSNFFILSSVFKNCAISEIVIPNGVVTIESQAFYGNPFKNLVFPDTLTKLAEDALQNCQNLERFELTNDLSEIISNLNKIGSTPKWYIEGEPYLVGTDRSSAPNGIGPKAVYTTIPGKASQVDWEWIEVVSDAQIKRYTTSTDSNGNKTTISTVETKTEEYNGTEIGKKYLTKFTPTSIEAGNLTIVAPSVIVDYNGNFHEIEGIVSLKTNEVANQKFQSGDSVSLELLSGYTYIGSNCFNNANGKKIANIVVPMTIKYIGTNAFVGTKTSSVRLPNLEYIGASAFANCSNLTSAEFSNSITQIPNDCFQNSGLTSFVVPQYLTTIGSSAFNSTKITKLYLPATLTEIGTSAFANCANLTSVEGLSNTKITEIQTQTFDKCSNLYRVYLPSTVKTIGFWAFNNCSRLTNFTFGSSLEDIVRYAFFGCASLSNLEFPATLKSIGTQAFDLCAGITKITFKHTDMSNLDVAASAFNGTTSALQVYIQSGIQLANFKAKFDGTSIDRGFAEDATLFYQNTSTPLAVYKSKEWKQVCQVVVYCGDAGSATIKFEGKEDQFIPSLKTKTFNVVQGTTYSILMRPNPNKKFVSLTINNELALEGNGEIGEKTYPVSSGGDASITQDTNIIITFDSPLVILDPNDGLANHIANEGDNKTTFTINVRSGENEDDYKKGDKDFYFYSTNKLDTEINQTGKRFDVGVKYSVVDLDGVNVLYAIYLKPTEQTFNITNNGTISLGNKNVTISNLVIPKKVNNIVVKSIADYGFSRVNDDSSKIIGNSLLSGIITMPSTINTIGKRAFAGNTGIVGQFSFPYNLTTLNGEAFALCHFNSININKLNPSSNVVEFSDDILYTKSADRPKIIYQFALGSNKKDINNVNANYIASYAFADSGIQTFDDSGVVVSYGKYAFADCKNLNQFVFRLNAASVTCTEKMFDGTTKSLKVYVPSGQVVNYLNKWGGRYNSNTTDKLGFQNGAFVYEGNPTLVAIPYAQISNSIWYQIFKVIATFGEGEIGGESITIVNKSESQSGATYTNSFENYKDAFGAGITYKDYFREDWALDIVVTFKSDQGYILNKLTYSVNGGSTENEITLLADKFTVSTYTHNIDKFKRNGDWHIKAYFKTRNQNISIYLDSGVDKASTGLSNPTSATFNGKSYELYAASVLFNRSFTLSRILPKSSYAIVSYRYAKATDDDGNKIENANLEWKYESVKSTNIGTNSRFNSTNIKTWSNIKNDYVVVIDTVYAPVILHLSGVFTPLGMVYNDKTKQYEKIDGASLIQNNFSTFTIPEYYDNEKQGSAELYYFLNNSQRLDTGFEYEASLLNEGPTGYYILEGQFFTPIDSSKYDTTKKGEFQLKSSVSSGAIPKKIGGVATTTILSNLRADASLYSGMTIILPKTVTTIKTGAFAMSQANGPIYFPTKLTNMEEGSLTTTKEAKFNQTRLSSITYAFAISNDKNYITISNGKTLVCANSNIAVSSIPSGITKLGAYVFAGRSSGEYSDSNNSVVSYGVGVFFNTTIYQFTFTKKSDNVAFDGLLLNAKNKVTVYVADDGYMSKLNNRGFWSYTQTQALGSNPYSSMYVKKTTVTGDLYQNPAVTDNYVSLYAIYKDNNWIRVYFYTHTSGSTYSFISTNKYDFVDNGQTFAANGLLQYTIEISTGSPTTIRRIDYFKYITKTLPESTPYSSYQGNLTEAIQSQDFDGKLEKSTHIAIETSAVEYSIIVNFTGNQNFESNLLENLDMTDVFSIEVYANDKQLNASQIAKEQNKYIISGAPYGAMLTITLTNKFTNSIFSIYSHSDQNKAFGYDYVGVKNQFVFDAFEVTGGKTISAFVAVMPISLNINGGIGDIPRYTTAISGGTYTFNISSAESLTNGNAEFYYFSDDKDKLDFTDTRYDTSNTYSRPIDEIKSSSATRLKLYARYAEYSTSNWTMDNSGCVLYTGTGATGKFLNSNSSSNSKNFVVVPKEINYSIVKGLQSNAFSELGDTVNYILLPGGEFVTIGATMLGTVNSVTKIQLPSGISSIAVATFQNASKLTDFILNESLESNYSTPNGVLYNSNRTILYAHPRQKEMTSSTILGTISTIEEYACYECDLGTAELNLPDATQIKQRAFQNAGGIKSVTFGNALQTVAQYAFYGCPNLQSAQNIANVEDCAFMNCNSLETTTFNSNCSTIGVSGFENCSSLISCQFSTSLKSISNRSFYATGLTNANLKDVLYLGVESFANCNDLSSITLSENLTYIPQYCFYNCGLTTLTIPANVTTIDRYSFKNNTSLTVIVFNGAPNSINGSSFENAESIEYIQLKTTFKMCWEGITKWFLYSLSNIKSGVWRYSETKITNNSFVKTKSVLELKDIGFYYFIADNNVSVQVDGDSTLYWYNSLSSAFNSKASGNTSVVTMYADDSIYSELNINSETNITLEATNKYIVTIYRGSASTATRNREIFHITGGSMKMGTKNNNLILDGNKDAGSLGNNISSMIYIEEGSFVMNGGKIQNCIADFGGAIYIAEEGATTLKGGIIQNCVARINGGAILNNGSLSISSVKLQSNKANERGGAIATKGNFSTSNNAIIEKNSAAIDGGGIYLFGNNGRVALQNVIIKSNKAAYGGGVYIRGGLTVYLWPGCAISNNTASSLGGGLFSAASADNKVQFHGATISYNTANDGAGVYLEGGSYGNYYTGTISYNTADTSKGNGGGIFAGKNSKFYFGYNSDDKLSISNNEAYRGAGVYISDAEYCYMRTNVIISHNNATQDGGGIYYDYHSSLYRSGINIYCTINYNKANYGGGIYFKGDKLEDINAGPKISNVTIQGNTGRVFGSALFLNHAAVVIYGQTFIYGQYYAMDRGCLYIDYDEDWSNTGKISVLGNKKGAANGFAFLYGSDVIPKYWMERYVKYFNYNGKYGPTTAWLTEITS